MFGKLAGFFIALIGSVLVLFSAHAQPHRATRLGNPATRFANPLNKPEDLRNLIRSETLREDVEFIARECGYRGTMDDLRQAAATNAIRPLSIPVGTRLPAMSSRENGEPVLLREVLWAGKEPIDAYEFYFVSQGRRYRVVAPKACANFWVEDHGAETRPVLALDCNAPNEVALGRAAQVCLAVRNVGDESEPLAAVKLPLPDGVGFVSATADGKFLDGSVVWELLKLAPKSSNQFCVTLKATNIGVLSFHPTAQGRRSALVQSQCELRVVGVPAVLLEVVDLNDPIEVGGDEVYEITVLNQGTAALTNVKLVCTLEAGQQFVSGTGTTAVSLENDAIDLEPISALQPKEKAAWRVTVKTLTVGDVRFTAELSSDQFHQPIKETEATQQY